MKEFPHERSSMLQSKPCVRVVYSLLNSNPDRPYTPPREPACPQSALLKGKRDISTSNLSEVFLNQMPATEARSCQVCGLTLNVCP